MGAVGCFLGMIISDVFGRRDLLIVGALGQALFLFLVAGVGEKTNPTPTDARALVAGVVLFIWIFTGYGIYPDLFPLSFRRQHLLTLWFRTWPPVSYAVGDSIRRLGDD